VGQPVRVQLPPRALNNRGGFYFSKQAKKIETSPII